MFATTANLLNLYSVFLSGAGLFPSHGNEFHGTSVQEDLTFQRIMVRTDYLLLVYSL
jgi:hypothetical protein